MTDLMGPADAPNSVTSRPADDRTFAGADTWFKDCTGPLLDDGTKLKAGFMNGFLANLRALVRGNGNTLAATPVIPEIDADDLILRGVQHLIQRGQVKYAVAAGGANLITAALSPALVEYKAGVAFNLMIANENTDPVDINFNGLGFKDVKHPDGNELLPGTFKPGMVVTLVYDGNRFQYVNMPFRTEPKLAANRDYYVDWTNGNDANNGLAAGSGNAFKTIQKAINTACGFDLNGFTVTIHVAAGTYVENVMLKNFTGTGGINIIGDETTPANCHINPTSGPAVTSGGTVSAPANGYILAGLKFSAPANGVNSGIGVWAAVGGVWLRNIEFGTCIYAHIFSVGARVDIAGAAVGGGFLRVTGNAGVHMWAINRGHINLYTPSLVIPGGVQLGTFVQADDLGLVTGTFNAITGGANVTSTKKFDVKTNGVIKTNGSGTSYFPGDIAGTQSLGGQYA